MNDLKISTRLAIMIGVTSVAKVESGSRLIAQAGHTMADVVHQVRLVNDLKTERDQALRLVAAVKVFSV